MAPAVTYDGVESAEGGNIFQGMSFWVAHRVPMRNDLLSKIKANGGAVVPLEKNATLLIADHARKDAPAGSYSWKFITDSVEYGAAQVPDKYRIGPDPDAPRPVAGRGLTSSSRVPFTHADKALLAKWVLSKPLLSRQGNELFQGLEEVSQRHTWQSWRNHFVKQMQHMTPHELKMLAATAPDLHSTQVGTTQPSETQAAAPASQPQSARSAVTPVQQPSPDEVTSVVQLRKGGRNEFTTEDDALLAFWALAYRQQLGKNNFTQLANQHSWDSWKNRWNKKLRGYSLEQLQMMASTVPDDTSSFQQPDPAAAPSPAIQPRTQHDGPGSGAMSTQPTVVERPGSEADETRIETGEAAETQQAPAETELATTAVEPHDISHEEERPPLQSPEVGTGSAAEDEEAEPLMAEGENTAKVDDDDMESMEEVDLKRNQFYCDLMDFTDCEPEHFVWPKLYNPDGREKGRKVDLYDLAQAFEAQGVARDDVDWDEVARELGWAQEEEGWIAAALEKCWDERLQDFLEAMNAYEGEADTADEEEGRGEELEQATLHSSPPVQIASLKRTREPDHISSTASVRKRRRLRDVEIPSTPDEQVGISRELRIAHEMSLSPSLHPARRQPSQQTQHVFAGRSSRQDTSSLPLHFTDDHGGMHGQREQDTSSDEGHAPTGVILRTNSNGGAAKRRTLPPGFARPSAQTQPARQSLPAFSNPPSSRPSPYSTTETELADSEAPDEAVAEWKDRFFRIGYPEHIIDLALHHTTFQPGPAAEHVLDSLTNDNGIPTDTAGVWLPAEDRAVRRLMETNLSEQASSALQLTEQKKMREEQRRLIERHTWEGLNRRKRYLRKTRVQDQEERAERRSTEEERRKVAEEKANAGALTLAEKKRREMELRKMMMGD